jgi:hypothetical protein
MKTIKLNLRIKTILVAISRWLTPKKYFFDRSEWEDEVKYSKKQWRTIISLYLTVFSMYKIIFEEKLEKLKII